MQKYLKRPDIRLNVEGLFDDKLIRHLRRALDQV